MIISASRRTDIPALYPEWFINRLKERYLLVKNPMNPAQVSKINLAPDEIDCIVFWTKNPAPIFKYLPLLSDFNYYFHFTLTPYGPEIECNLPDKKTLVNTFRELSDLIGPHRVIWRYDPVFYTEKYGYNFHLQKFEELSGLLSKYTEKCFYSFITVYKKCERNMKHINFSRPSDIEIVQLSERFSQISGADGISLRTCAEDTDLSLCGISKGKCIDDELIGRMSGKTLSVSKDKNQRNSCLCAESIDIGAYNTCTHRCIYCYANYDHNKAAINYRGHNSESPLITGNLSGGEIIRERKKLKTDINQLQLFE